MFSETDKKFMQQAIALAKQAETIDEVPIGAILVLDNKVIGEGFNSPISDNDPTSHAEINAIRDAAQNLKNYRLVNTTLYVTLEPCTMCIGAIVNSRINRVVYAAKDDKYGALATLKDFNFNHKVVFEGGLLKDECSIMLSKFFKNKR